MKILNFGSLNIDFVYDVEHFVRPGETISSRKLEKFCGGKGLNQSIAIAKAGAVVYHAGCIGPDGDMLKKQLESNGVHTDYLSVSNTPSGNAIIQVDESGQNCILLYGGANRQITPAYVDSVLAHFEPGDIVLLQNEINCMEYIMVKAHEQGLEIALNPSPIDDNLKNYPLNYVKYFILNEIEGNELTGQTDADSITKSLLSRFPESAVVLTLGKKGVRYSDRVQTHTHGIYDVKVVDTTAAGDTFTGYFLSGIVKKLPIPDALEIASKASSIAVSKNGASDSIPLLNEVETCRLQSK